MIGSREDVADMLPSDSERRLRYLEQNIEAIRDILRRLLLRLGGLEQKVALVKSSFSQGGGGGGSGGMFLYQVTTQASGGSITAPTSNGRVTVRNPDGTSVGTAKVLLNPYTALVAVGKKGWCWHVSGDTYAAVTMEC